MTKISKETLKKLANEGFFNDWKSIEQVTRRLSQKGFSIIGKKIGLLAQLLTYLCQEDILERDEDKKGNWKYRKLKNG